MDKTNLAEKIFHVMFLILAGLLLVAILALVTDHNDIARIALGIINDIVQTIRQILSRLFAAIHPVS